MSPTFVHFLGYEPGKRAPTQIGKLRNQNASGPIKDMTTKGRGSDISNEEDRERLEHGG